MKPKIKNGYEILLASRSQFNESANNNRYGCLATTSGVIVRHFNQKDDLDAWLHHQDYTTTGNEK